MRIARPCPISSMGLASCTRLAEIIGEMHGIDGLFGIEG
jgi:hypothetical protein